MAFELFNKNGHICLMYSDLVQEEDVGTVQANQFLVIDNGHGALIDPGGQMTYNELYIGITRYFAPKKLDAILASHADPDIVASVGRWITSSDCKVYIPSIWARFIPHFCANGKTDGRIIGIPDAGMRIAIGQSHIAAIPAHFLHSEGNHQFYDPVSKILFSGDMGASLVLPSEAAAPVEDFDAHIRAMEGFHRRYMVSNKVCRLWVNMVRRLDIESIVPQHGRPMMGKPMVARFLSWIENLECGVDLMTQDNYRLPA